MAGVGRVAYTPDGAVLYTAGSDGYVRVFSAKPEDEGQEQLGIIEYHDSHEVRSMDASVSPSRKRLDASRSERWAWLIVLGCADGKPRHWS